MPINVSSYIQPKNGNNFYVLEDVYLKGGFQVRNTFADLATINSQNLKEGMLAYTLDTKLFYQLEADLVTWKNANFGSGGGGVGARKTIVYSSDEIAVNGNQVVELALGNSVLIQELSVSVPVTVEAFSTKDLTETNPYKFIPTADHLADDGSTLLSNGETVNNRRYTLLTNNDSPITGKIYFRLTNNLSTLATAVTLTVQYLTLEGV